MDGHRVNLNHNVRESHVDSNTCERDCDTLSQQQLTCIEEVIVRLKYVREDFLPFNLAAIFQFSSMKPLLTVLLFKIIF